MKFEKLMNSLLSEGADDGKNEELAKWVKAWNGNNTSNIEPGKAIDFVRKQLKLCGYIRTSIHGINVRKITKNNIDGFSLVKCDLISPKSCVAMQMGSQDHILLIGPYSIKSDEEGFFLTFKSDEALTIYDKD
jgi:hypothetical protein